jgi:hypothetical protein
MYTSHTLSTFWHSTELSAISLDHKSVSVASNWWPCLLICVYHSKDVSSKKILFRNRIIQIELGGALTVLTNNVDSIAFLSFFFFSFFLFYFFRKLCIGQNFINENCCSSIRFYGILYIYVYNSFIAVLPTCSLALIPVFEKLFLQS